MTFGGLDGRDEETGDIRKETNRWFTICPELVYVRNGEHFEGSPKGNGNPGLMRMGPKTPGPSGGESTTKCGDSWNELEMTKEEKGRL